MRKEQVRLLYKVGDVVPHVRLRGMALIHKIASDLYVTSKDDLRIGVVPLDQGNQRRELRIINDDYAIVEQAVGVWQPKAVKIGLSPPLEILLVIRHQILVWLGDSLQDVVKVLGNGKNPRMAVWHSPQTVNPNKPEGKQRRISFVTDNLTRDSLPESHQGILQQGYAASLRCRREPTELDLIAFDVSHEGHESFP